MTKLSIPAAANKSTQLLERGVKGAALIATTVAQAGQKLDLEVGELIIAVLLYAGHISHQLGGTKAQFVAAAGAAFDDAVDLWKREEGHEREQEKVQTSIADVLRAAKALCQRHWIQNDQAQKWEKAPTERDGKRLVNCNVKDPAATRFSAIGAIDRAAPDELVRLAAREAMLLAVKESGFVFPPGSLIPTVLIDWNDTAGRKKDEVLFTFDKAVEIAEASAKANAAAPRET